MKRLTLFILIAVLGTAPALYSQTGKLARHDRKDFSYGVKAGLNATTIGGDANNTETKIGLALGVFGMIKLGTDIGVSADILYSQQGCNLGDFTSQGVVITDAYYTLDYLNIPLLANWYVPWVPGLTVKGGLQPGFLLSSEMKVSTVSIDASEVFNSVDLSIPLGISYELDFGLLLDLRYNIGVSNLWNNDENAAGVEDISMNNSVFQVTVGYRF